MSIFTSASAASAWRGYEYYTEKKVIAFAQVGDGEYTGCVSGSAKKPYQVHINVSHIRQSRCNCPHADGTRVICKHMVALYFAAYPVEAVSYKEQVDKYEEETEERLEAHYAEVERYVKSLSKKELQTELYDALLQLEETW